MDIKNIRSELVGKYNRLSNRIDGLADKIEDESDKDLQVQDLIMFNNLSLYRQGVLYALRIIDKECKKI